MNENSLRIDGILRSFAGRPKGLLLWIAIHLILIMTGFLAAPVKVDTSFFSILPSVANNAVLAEAQETITRRANNRIQLMIGAEEFPEARKAAFKIGQDISGLPSVLSADWETADSTLGEIRRFIHEYRYHLLGEADRHRLENGEGELLAFDALGEVYNPVSLADLNHLDTDPFLLTERTIRSYMEIAGNLGGPWSPRDGVMYTESDGRFYVLLTVSLHPEKDQSPGIEEIGKSIAAVEKSIPGTEIIVSGFPVHNSEAGIRARREIGWITSVSMLILTLILLTVYRSPLPWIASVLMIVSAAAVSFSQTHLIFGGIHLFTLVLGTSLIGISIDYSLHFFTARMQVLPGETTLEVLRDILPGIALGMATTVISYIALALTSIPLLRQIAVFTIFGLFSSFATVLLVYPAFGRTGREHRSGIPQMLQTFLSRVQPESRRKGFLILLPVFVIAVLLISGLRMLSLDNDVRSFYTMSDELARSEKRASEIGESSSWSRYFLVVGESEDELLERESELGRRLRLMEEKGLIGSWIAVSRFVPTKVDQAESLDLVRRYLAPLASRQFAALGFPDGSAENWEQELVRLSDSNLEMQYLLNQSFFSSLENLWIGPVGQKYASIVLPLEYNNAGIFEPLTGEDTYWVDSVSDVSETLQENSRAAILIVAAAYLLIFTFMSMIRGLKAALRICSVPFLAALMAAGLIGIIGAPFNLFAVFGLILTLGIGIDYTIFLNESRHRFGSTYLAIALSCLSTLLSFGALSLSSFAPVADFGRAVLWGVLFSFLLAPFVQGRTPEAVLNTDNLEQPVNPT